MGTLLRKGASVHVVKDDDETLSIHLTMKELKPKEIPHIDITGAMWDKAMLDEFLSWELHGVIHPVSRAEVQQSGVSPISCRWVFVLKPNTGKAKARLVARGFEDRALAGIEIDSPTAARDSFRLQLAIGANFGWDMLVCDVPTAFLRSDKWRFKRDVYIKPPTKGAHLIPESMRVADGGAWKVDVCVYGLNDAPRMWYETVIAHLKDAGLKQSSWDPCLMFHRDNTGLIGTLVLHVDDCSACGNEKFLKMIKTVFSKDALGVKEFKRASEGMIQYCGVELTRGKDASYRVTMDKYHNMIDVCEIDKGRLVSDPLTEVEVTRARSALGALAWMATQTRPELSLVVSELVGWLAPAQKPTVCLLKRINKVVLHVKENPANILFQRGNIPAEFLTICSFGDASWASMPGLRSQQGCNFWLTDQRVLARILELAPQGKDSVKSNADSYEKLPLSIVSWLSGRIQRIVRSTFAAEVMANTTSVDRGIVLICTLNEILGGTPHRPPHPSVVFSDCMSVITNCSTDCPHQMEKRLRLDLFGIREAVSEDLIRLRWIPSREQLADALTKWNTILALRLQKVLDEGFMDVSCYNPPLARRKSRPKAKAKQKVY